MEEQAKYDAGEFVTRNDDGSTTVRLRRPLELEGQRGTRRIESVTLREPIAGDLEEAMDGGKGDVQKNLRLICQLSELSMREARALKSCDYVAMQEVVVQYMKSSPGELADAAR